MSLSAESRDRCKRCIAEIRDGATSLLEVLSKPRIDVDKASDLSTEVFESSAKLHQILTFAFIQKAFGGDSDAES